MFAEFLRALKDLASFIAHQPNFKQGYRLVLESQTAATWLTFYLLKIRLRWKKHSLSPS